MESVGGDCISEFGADLWYDIFGDWAEEFVVE